MRETDLRRAFASITPDESLLRATIEKVEAQKYATAAKQAAALAQSTRKASPYAFAYRLASVACALLLVLGMGISIGKDVTQPLTDDAAAYTRTQFNDMDPQVAASSVSDVELLPTPAASTTYNEDERADMLARAKALDTEYVIIDAVLSSCYILPAEEDGTHASMLSFDHANVVAASEGAFGAILTNAQTESVSVPMAMIRGLSAEEQNAVIDAMGLRICVLIYNDGGTLRIDPQYILAE